MSLTSRERVRNAINFREVDRVPIDIGGTKVTGICIDAYIELLKFLNLDIGLPKVYDQFAMLARMDEAVRKRLHCDVIELENPSESWGIENRDWKPWTTGMGNEILVPGEFNPIADGKGYIHIKDSNGNSLAYMPEKQGLYFERACETKMSDKIKKTDPQAWANSIPLYTDEHLRLMEEQAKRLYEDTEYSISGGFLKGMMGSNGIFAGHTITDWLCLLVTDRDYAFSILQATALRNIENLKLYLQAVGNYIDTILISGTDWGTQKGELFNPDIFRDLYVPNIKMMNDYVHNNSNAKTIYHCCGSIVNLIDHFITAGIDILNPVQVSAENMVPSELKKRFGDRIVFWGGGCDTQGVLQCATVNEVRSHVKELVSNFAPGGGFVFAAIHDIQYGVPPQNIVAMADAAIEFGSY